MARAVNKKSEKKTLSPSEKAEAFVSTLITAQELDTFHMSLIDLSDMVEAGEINLFLTSPDKNDLQKRKFIQTMLKELSSEALAEMLTSQLAEEGVDSFTEQSLRPFLAKLKAEADSCKVISLTLAERFRPEDLHQMSQILSEKLGHHAVLSLEIDRHLLGGAVIQYGNYISDYSLKTQLKLFREKWEKAALDTES